MRVGIAGGALRPLLVVAAGAVLIVGGCELDKTEEPVFTGPSETGLSAQLTALPDVLNADGVSQSVVEMVLRDANGRPVSGRAVLFCVTPTVPTQPGGVPPPSQVVSECVATNPTGSESLVPQTGYTYVGPVQSGIVMATNGDGVARVVWVAGMDHNTIIVIGVRTYGIDASRGFLRTVQIFQQ